MSREWPKYVKVPDLHDERDRFSSIGQVPVIPDVLGRELYEALRDKMALHDNNKECLAALDHYEREVGEL